MDDFVQWTLIIAGFTLVGNVIELLATFGEWAYFKKLEWNVDNFIGINATGFAVWLILIFWLLVIPRQI